MPAHLTLKMCLGGSVCWKPPEFCSQQSVCGLAQLPELSHVGAANLGAAPESWVSVCLRSSGHQVLSQGSHEPSLFTLGKEVFWRYSSLLSFREPEQHHTVCVCVCAAWAYFHPGDLLAGLEKRGAMTILSGNGAGDGFFPMDKLLRQVGWRLTLDR